MTVHERTHGATSNYLAGRRFGVRAVIAPTDGSHPGERSLR